MERIEIAYEAPGTAFVTEEAFYFFNDPVWVTKRRMQRIIRVPDVIPSLEAAVRLARPWDVIFIRGNSHESIKIRGKDTLEIRGGWVTGVVVENCRAIQIRDVSVDGRETNRHGIYLGGSNADIVIRDCLVTGCSKGSSGLYIEGQNSNVAMVNGQVFSNGGNGITFETSDSGRYYVVNSTICDNGGAGVRIADGGSEIYVINSILSFNGTRAGATARQGIVGSERSPEKTRMISNLIVGNQGESSPNGSSDIGGISEILDSSDSGNMTGSGTEGTGVSQSPSSDRASIFDERFLTYHLTAGSPARNRGIAQFIGPDGMVVPLYDNEGDERRRRTDPVSIGAYEYWR